MDRISVDEASRNLEDLLNVVANGKQRFVIGDPKGEQAACLSLEDLSLLETMDQDSSGEPAKVDHAELNGRLGARVAASAANGERFVITRNGREMAAIVPMRDIQTLVGLDGEIDLALAKQILDRQLGRE